MEADPTRMCELLVGLGEVDLVGIDDGGEGAPLVVVIGSRRPRPMCGGCGGGVWSKGERSVVLVDLAAFGRPVRLRWRKRRWTCPSPECAVSSFIEQDAGTAPVRGLLTSRAARWATAQVGQLGRSVQEVATELGCGWHTVNGGVARWGEALLEADTSRFGAVEAVGVDETLLWRQGRWRIPQWATSVAEWLDRILWAVLDLSGPYRTAYDRVLPNASQVADPFHVIRLANQRLDEVRRRVQNETLGYRGRKHDPLYRTRRLLTAASERISDGGRTRLRGLLDAGDPHGEVRTASHAKETVRAIYGIDSIATALSYTLELADDLQDESCPPEINQLGRTIARWAPQITNWHISRVTNGPTEALNNLIKRVKRTAFGFRNFANYRIRALLYAGKPNWNLLATVTPH